jgi:hypothetical protein
LQRKYNPYYHVERRRLAPPNKLMAHPTPFNGPSYYHGTEANTGEVDTFQQGQDGDVFAEGFSSRMYPTSQAETLSNLAAPGDIRSNITSSIGFHGNAVNFSQGSGSFLPSADPPFISNSLFRNQISSFNPTAFHMQPDSFPTALETGSLIPMALDSNGYFPMEFDNPLPTLDVLDQITTLGNAPIGLAVFPSLGDVGTWDEGLLSAINDPFLLSNTGQFKRSMKPRLINVTY